MVEFKILITGCVKKLKDGWLASPTTVLLRDRGLTILVDPGSNQGLLLAKLRAEKLQPQDIDMIFLTHHHLDHILNIRIFPTSDVLLDGDRMNGADEVFAYSQNIPGTDIEVIPTPGHTWEHASLLVKTAKGKVAIAGDLFWWLDGEEQKTDYESLISHKDPGGAEDENLLRISRIKVLAMADWIIPGHGEIFKVPK